jgi:hypothetical protein
VTKKAAPKAKAKKKAPVKAVELQQAEEKKTGWKFPSGNKYWQCRAKHGRDGIWATPNDLLQDCLAYFEWVEENPLYEEKGFAYQGTVTKEQIYKMRAATLDGLELHLGISHTTWDNYRAKPDFVEVIERIEKAIRHQKFAGAAADLLNANIIARDLGLRDTVNNQLTGANGGPIATAAITSDMDPKKASELYKQLLNG